MKTCHVCGQSWLAHAPDCRVRDDLARMQRVHDRLVAEGRDPELANRIGGYLAIFGHLACQQRPEMPSHADCNACGHKDICVILPQVA